MGSKDSLKIIQGKRVGLDTSILIYILEGNQEFTAATQILQLAVKGKITLYLSVIALTELLTKYYQLGREDLIESRLAFAISEYINIVNVDKVIAVLSAQLRAKYRLRTPDAIHLATAMENNCCFFLTADQDFENKKFNNVSLIILKPKCDK